MRKFLQRTISIFISLLLVQTPGAQAISYTSAVAKVTEWFEGEGALKGAKLTPFSKKVGANGKQIRGLMISGGAHDGYVVLEGTAKEAQMKEWKKLKELISYKQKGKDAIARGLKGGDVLRRITPETMSFLIALGTLEYIKLVFTPGKNPLGVYQQVESEKHPLTHLSFGAFMYASGVTTPILQSLFNPKNKIQKYIPYLGMSAGMIASDVVNEIANLMDGKLDKCLLSLEQQVENFEQISTSCDKAFESWSEYSLDYLSSLTPSLVSLVVATGLAGKFEELVVKKALIKMGLEIFLLPVTGEASMAFRFGSWTIRTMGNVLPFVGVNEIVGHPIENTVKTYIQSANFRYFQKDLMASLVTARRSNWEEERTKKSLEKVLEAAKSFKEWRKLNMEKITGTYNAWLAKVSSYAASYNLTEFVYGEFLDKADPKNRRDKALTLMRRPAPLFGVDPSPGENDQVENPYENPTGLMEQQLKGIVEKSKEWQKLDFLDQFLSEYEIKSLGKSILQTAQTAKKLQALAEQALTLTDMENLEQYWKICGDIGKQFSEINKFLSLNARYPGLYPGTREMTYSGANAQKPERELRLWKVFRSIYGNPFPINQVGGLFFAALEATPKVRSNSGVLSENERINGFIGFRPAQTAFMKMLLGPSLNTPQEFVKPNTWNLPFSKLGSGLAEFVSPRLVSQIPTLKFTTGRPVVESSGINGQMETHTNRTALNMPLEVSGQKYANLYEYAIAQWPNFLAKDGNEFSKLWEKEVLPAYQDGWKKLEPTYNTFVADYLETISKSTRSFDNTSPLYNGQVREIDLERKFYSMILGEIIRTYNQNNDALFEPKAPFQPLNFYQIYEENKDPMWGDLGADHLPLFTSLDRNSVLSLYSHVAQHKAASKVLWNESHPGQNLKIQKEIENDFASMMALIREVKNLFEGKKAQVVYTNSQIVEIRDAFTKKYDGWINEPVAGIGGKLNSESLKLYQFSLRALKLLMNELATSALMANELSYERSSQNPGMSGIKDPECMMQAGGAKLGAGGNKAVTNKQCGQ